MASHGSSIHPTPTRMQRARYGALALAAALGVTASACVGTALDQPSDNELAVEDVGVSQQALNRQTLASTATAGSIKPVNGGNIVVYFQCGWDPKSLSAQCTCRGDDDCNRMFTSGFCGANASCDTGAGTCTCDLKL